MKYRYYPNHLLFAFLVHPTGLVEHSPSLVIIELVVSILLFQLHAQIFVLEAYCKVLGDG